MIQAQKIQRMSSPSWHHSGFHGAWLGTRRVSHPGSSPVSVSVAHAIRDNILAFLATVQDDLGS